MDWIPLKKRWPEYGEGVLITDGEIVTSAERAVNIRGELRWACHGWSGQEWDWDFREDAITHWMSLQKPPKNNPVVFHKDFFQLLWKEI